MTNTAMATALAAFYQDKSWIRYTAYGYISFLFVAILIHDGGSAHWFSDIVAGGLMGIAFGATIGKSFRKYRNPTDFNSQTSIQNSYSFSVYPQLSPDYSGIYLNVRF